MQIICLENDSHETSSLTFSEKYKRKIKISAAVVISILRVKGKFDPSLQW